ncbi:SapC family protein [Martelella alba]|uniref:SapC family protein n=1 Tax=Martelella alba TaxID=2590451 RepID=A0A506U9H3_9HYPH|nr:SapC family protein [Martelella alba]TPW28477.1 SapC family protein [Martelella alba]
MADDTLPLFYKSPQVLRFEDHKDLVLDTQPDFAFAATTNAIPLPPSEFVAAARCYPLVFAKTAGLPAAVAVTGLKQNQNLFVDASGAWLEGHYIPAYIRRYPFILIQSQDETQTVLGFEGSCQRIRPAGDLAKGLRLFNEDGTAGEATKPMMEFCSAYHQQSLLGNEFIKALQEHDLLVEKHVEMSFADKGRYRLDGLLVVDQERYRALPETVLFEWHKKGFTDAVVLHLASSQNWQHLLEIETKRISEARAA